MEEFCAVSLRRNIVILKRKNRARRSYTDSIFCLKQVSEKKMTGNQKIHIIFINIYNLQKIYNTVLIVKLYGKS